MKRTKTQPPAAEQMETVEVPYVPGTRRICTPSLARQEPARNPRAGWTNDTFLNNEVDRRSEGEGD